MQTGSKDCLADPTGLQSQACSAVRKDFNSDGNQHRPGGHSHLYWFLEPSSQHILREAEYGRTSIAILKSTIRGHHSANRATLKPSQVLCSSFARKWVRTEFCTL